MKHRLLFIVTAILATALGLSALKKVSKGHERELYQEFDTSHK